MLSGPLWMVAREYDRVAGAGGLKDAVAQHARAFVRMGGACRVILPWYGSNEGSPLLHEATGSILEIPLPLPGQPRTVRVELLRAEDEGVEVILASAPDLFLRDEPYTYSRREALSLGVPALSGRGHRESFEMNVLLQFIALELALQAPAGERPAVIQCHDGHAALLPLIARAHPRYTTSLASVGMGVTVHNGGLGYHQGTPWVDEVSSLTGLAPQSVSPLLGGEVDPLLLGALHGDWVNTVSPGYAWELLNSDEGNERSGGLGEAFVRHGVELHGIYNGLELGAYTPAPSRASAREGLLRLQEDLPAGIRAHGALDPGSLSSESTVLGTVGRITGQKGIDWLAEALGRIASEDPSVRVVILGGGDLAPILRQLARQLSGQMLYLEGYSDTIAPPVYRALDLFVNAARFEPCGLTDLMALLYGALPVVREVGGLRKVRHGVDGFLYRGSGAAELYIALRDALKFIRARPSAAQRMLAAGRRRVRQDHDWERIVLEQYCPLYEAACANRQNATSSSEGWSG